MVYFVYDMISRDFILINFKVIEPKKKKKKTTTIQSEIKIKIFLMLNKN